VAKHSLGDLASRRAVLGRLRSSDTTAAGPDLGHRIVALGVVRSEAVQIANVRKVRGFSAQSGCTVVSGEMPSAREKQGC
jgi:hypothetical protein